MATWFLAKGVDLVVAVTAWRADGGCAMQNVHYVADLLEEEEDYVTTSGWSYLIPEDCDMWYLLVGHI